MDLSIFEELAPVCPRCLHGDQTVAPLRIAHSAETRAGALWHGILHCSNSACWMEFPVIDAIPVIVPDPKGFLAGARYHVMARQDLPELLHGVLGDACGPGSEFDTSRHHLSLYGVSHYADWMGQGAPAAFVDVLKAGFDLLGPLGDGPAIDLGGSVGRGSWELAGRTAGPVLCADLNFSMLRLGRTLISTGTATVPVRRSGIVYDETTITLPEDPGARRLDFWALDAMALPFQTGAFGLASAINLVDCIPGPTDMIAETARILRPGARAVFSTPYDWSANATDPAGWMGGHSQRGPAQGAGEPVLRATLEQYGLPMMREAVDVPWRLALHARSVMEYSVHILACERH